MAFSSSVTANRIAHMATIRGLAPVLIVPEVLETLEHYRDKLGFETREWAPNPAAYGYAKRDECHIHFNQGEQPRPNSEVVQPDLFDVYLWVDDVAALHEEFVGRGADLLHEPIERPWGMLEIRVQDPNGYILAFGQRTPA
jgi:catechol 2,3-dioxygenase-like lactoylglutathione lyase family enzyme